MRTDANNYLNEFENEFEMEFERGSDYETGDSESDLEYEMTDSELDNEYDNENYSADNEFELSDYEFESEFESEFEQDNEFEAFDAELDNEYEFEIENELESRFFEVLNGEHETEYEFEQQLNEIMHEAERDFFWKKAFNKVRALAKNKNLMSLAKAGFKLTPWGAAVTTALPLLKNATKLSRMGLRKGLTQLATDMVNNNLGGNLGGVVSGLMQNETGNGVSKRQVRDFLDIAEKSYENLAYEINKVGQVRTPQQVQQVLKKAPINALNKAIRATRNRRATGGRYIKHQVIQLQPGSRVCVSSRRVTIYRRR